MATKDTLTENRGWTWFPFDVRNWLTSQDVLEMTSSEEGLYIRMLAFQWMYDELPGDPRQLAKLLGRDQRQVTSFLKRWGGLFPEVPATRCNLQQNAADCGETPPSSENRRRVRNPKLYFLAVSQGKIDSGDAQSKPNTDTNGEGDDGGSAGWGPQPSAASPGTPTIAEGDVGREPVGAEHLSEPAKPQAREEHSAPPEPVVGNPVSLASAASDEPAVLASRFFDYQGRPAKCMDALPDWTRRFRTLLLVYGDELAAILDYAFKVDPFWSAKLVRSEDPLGYFEEKLKDGIIIDKFRSWRTAQKNRAKQPSNVREGTNGEQRNRTSSSNQGRRSIDNRAAADEAKRRLGFRVRGGV
jgi:hypothetical protein